MTAQARPAPAAPAIAKGALIAIAVLALLGAVASGVRLPLVSSDRDALLAMLVVGWLGCAVSAGSTILALGWRHPACLFGIGTGLLALAVIALTLLGALPAVAGMSPDRVGFVALGLIFLAKAVVGMTAFSRR
jgi:hypothetical protein